MVLNFSKMFAVYFLLVLISNTSCTKKKQSGAFNLVSQIDITVLDESNNDLLNPAKHFLKSINTSNITVAYIIDGKEVIVNQPNLDAPKGYILLPPEANSDFKDYRLRVFLNIAKSDNPVSKTTITWNSNDKNEITAYYSISGNSIVYTKLLLDGTEVWNVQTPNIRRSITLHK